MGPPSHRSRCCRAAPRKPRRVVALACVVAAGTLGACTHPSPPATAAIPGSGVRGALATVDHVIDGDTVDLRFGSSAPERVRLLGIDTPETVKPDTPVECFGPEASARTKELLPPATEVVVQRDAEARDRYGRLLVYVWRRSDGLFVNASLLTDGFARTLSIAPNTVHRSDLSAAAASARTNRAGLWGACPEGG